MAATPAPGAPGPAPGQASAPLPVLVLAGLTQRDAVLLTALAEAALLTTRQLVAVAGFGAERRARRRLGILRSRGLVALTGPGLRGAASPAWHLTRSGQRAAALLGATLPASALPAGAALLRQTLLAGDVYAMLTIARRRAAGAAAWTLLPQFAWPADRKPVGAGRPPRPWSVIETPGARLALELDRPGRGRREVAALVGRWAAWRQVADGWQGGLVAYLCATPGRAQEVAAAVPPQAAGWFVVTANPASILTFGTPGG
jgi:hypothetical protein